MLLVALSLMLSSLSCLALSHAWLSLILSPLPLMLRLSVSGAYSSLSCYTLALSLHHMHSSLSCALALSHAFLSSLSSLALSLMLP